MSATEFASCNIVPITKDEDASSTAVLESDGKWKTSSFYVDSSGRSSLSLPLRLDFSSEDLLQKFLDNGSIVIESEGGVAEEQNNEEVSSGSSIGIEAKVALTFGDGEAIVATVEKVSILSIKRKGSSIWFNTEIIVRVSKADGASFLLDGSSQVKTSIEVSAVFTERVEDVIGGDNSGLLIANLETQGLCSRVVQTRLSPFTLHLALTNAFSIAVRSVPGPLMGKTFLALTIRHSNTHSQPVTITNIEMHPGHSQEKLLGGDMGNEISELPSLIDMSKSVKWGYAAQSDPKLPIVLRPRDAVSTIIEVDAAEDDRSRLCHCPISVTGAIGLSSSGAGNASYAVARGQAEWLTSRAAVEPADAFRVDMKLDAAEGKVGLPLVVQINIANLSSEHRELVLSVADNSPRPKYVHGGQQAIAYAKKEGKRLFVEGLSDAGLDAKTIESHDRNLLAVDDSLLLGEVKPHSSTHSELRFVPLIEGCLNIPDFKLFDKKSGKTYSCVHNLRVVSHE